MRKNNETAKFIKKLGVNSKKLIRKEIVLPIAELPEQTVQESFSIDKRQLRNFLVIGMMRKQIFCIYHPQLRLYGSVDQHALHQRVRYEFYSKTLQGESTENFLNRYMQKSETKKNIEVISKKKYKKLLHIAQVSEKVFSGKQIEKYGMRIVIGEGHAYMQTFSEILGRILEDEALREICREIIQLELAKSNRIPKLLDSIVAQIACKSAIKFGDEVTKQWCEDLLLNATLCDFPWKCVHGRPTIHFQLCPVHQNRTYSLS